MADQLDWENYPLSLPGYEETRTHGIEIQRRLKDEEADFFSDEEDINLRITDFAQNGQVRSTQYKDVAGAETAINATLSGRTRTRIISIYSLSTIEPLQVTSELMRKILSKYHIHADFARIIFSFGEAPNYAEASSSSSSNVSIRTSLEGVTEASYEIRYVEENKREGQDPWSLRHTGVYHRHDSELDVFVLLHPMEANVAEKRLLKLIETPEENLEELKRITQNPFRLHLLLFSSYFDNWRWYFRHLGKEFSRTNNKAMVIKPEAINATTSFSYVQNLRNTADTVLFGRACCNGDLDLIKELMKCKVSDLSKLEDLQSEATKLQGFVESSDVLQGRIRNTIDLIGYTLNLHNQLESAKVNSKLRSLTEELRNYTKDTVDDSATVKIITFVSAIYLPGSFVGSLFGMNFFVFNSTSRNLQISQNFWIFIATWLPLTFITGAIYMLIVFIDSRAKEKDFRWLWQIKSRQKAVPTEKEA